MNIFRRQKGTLEKKTYLYKRSIMIHYISTLEVIRATGLSRSTIERARRNQDLKSHKQGRRVLFKIDEVREWIEK